MEKYIDMLDKNVITSKTDLKGKITYTSKAFCKISGYLPEELLGKNHNIVRHPDMPSSVYKELWNTIKMGETWSGEIKNRTKDGSYYWVQSDISPYYEYGKHVGYIAVRQDITNKKLVEEISVRDHLTKLYNRVKLDEEFAKEILRSQRFGHPLSIIVIDIDHFKSVNDTYGHLVGDSVLVNMAKLLEKNIRTIDILGRWGGEEFIIICPETESKDAYKLAEKIRQNVEKYEFTTVGNKTASFGVSQYVTGENEQQLVDRADKALYKAKEEGRNKVIVS
jgi:diguanylate cyclase (GGDEF)-like protein/PAS domain S-box-containing protein